MVFMGSVTQIYIEKVSNSIKKQLGILTFTKSILKILSITSLIGFPLFIVFPVGSFALPSPFAFLKKDSALYYNTQSFIDANAFAQRDTPGHAFSEDTCTLLPG